MQDFYRCPPNKMAQAMAQLNAACPKLVTDMHHETRVQAIIQYHALHLGTKLPKSVARTMQLTREQYMQVNTYILIFSEVK